MRSFLVFRSAPAPTSIKTRRWYVENTTGTVLGYVSWYAPWRKYCFTTANHTLVFDAQCLGEIQQFLVKAMSDHKESKTS